MKTSRFMGMFGALLLASLNPNTDGPKFRGSNFTVGSYNPIFFPKRKKLKGWMRENRRFKH